MRTIILLADNNDEFREEYQRFLSGQGFHVITATNPEETRAILRKQYVDLAIIDARLVDDDLDTDISGLTIAADETFRRIPKIILTGFPLSPEYLRNVLGQKAENILPGIASSVGKGEGPKRLLEAITDTLKFWPRLLRSTVKIADQIQADYMAARTQARHQYVMAVTVSVIGFLVIFAGIGMAWNQSLPIAIVGTASGIILQALSYLFFKRLDLSNRRLDVYHRELLETYWLELLLAASDQLPAEKQVASVDRTLAAATNRWLAPPQDTKRLGTGKTGREKKGEDD